MRTLLKKPEVHESHKEFRSLIGGTMKRSKVRFAVNAALIVSTSCVALFPLTAFSAVVDAAQPAVVVASLRSAFGLKRKHEVEKKRILFLATGSLVRGTLGYNMDAYLAEFVPAGGDEQQLIRLIDDYPNYALPLSPDVLTSSTGTVLKVKRDRGCDLPYRAMVLRTAPGDPMAIIPLPLSYEPRLEQRPAPGTILSCYRIVRR